MQRISLKMRLIQMNPNKSKQFRINGESKSSDLKKIWQKTKFLPQTIVKTQTTKKLVLY